MDCSRSFRFLRIAVTALCLTACVLLVALWVRSHRYRDSLDLYGGGSRMLRVVSWEGVVLFAPWVFGSGSKPEAGFSHSALSNAQLEALHAQVGRPPKKKWHAWKYSKHNYPGGSTERDLFLPHWFLVAVVGSIGAIPWIINARRYSLRTLLITTTLVAVVLGMIISTS
jgi:hypothetical protein